MSAHLPDFHALVERFEARLPAACARCSRYRRQPQSRMVRVPAAVLLTFGGVFSILPVLGIWMLPLGLLLLAVDLPALRPPLARMLCTGSSANGRARVCSRRRSIRISFPSRAHSLNRHGRTCHRKSGLPDLRHLSYAQLGQARVALPSTSCFLVVATQDVDGRHKAGHDEK